MADKKFVIILTHSYDRPEIAAASMRNSLKTRR